MHTHGSWRPLEPENREPENREGYMLGKIVGAHDSNQEGPNTFSELVS